MSMLEDRENRAVSNMIKGIIPPVAIGYSDGIGRQNNGQLSTAEIKGFGLLSGYAAIRHANNRLTLVFFETAFLKTKSCNPKVNGVPDSPEGQGKPDRTALKIRSCRTAVQLMCASTADTAKKKAGKILPNRRIKAAVETAQSGCSKGFDCLG